MAMYVNTNIAALNTYNSLNSNQESANAALQKLSSGKRINNAGDDAAGLAISNTMQAQINGNVQANRNVQDATSFIQQADGQVKSVTQMLQRMSTLATQSANGTYSSADRAAMQTETTNLAQEANNELQTSQFNGISLFNGNVNTTTKTSQAVGIGGATLTFGSGAGGAGTTTNTAIQGSTMLSGAITGGGSITFNYISSAGVVTTLTANVSAFTVGAGQDAAVLGAAALMTAVNTALSNLSSTNGNGNTIQISAYAVADSGTVGGVAMKGEAIVMSSFGFAGDSIEFTGQNVTGDGSQMANLGLAFSKTNTSGATIAQGALVNQVTSNFNMQVGAGAQNTYTLNIQQTNVTTLGLSNLSIADQSSATTAINQVNAAMHQINNLEANFGSIQNRLGYEGTNLTTTIQNTTSAQANILNADMASTYMDYSQKNVLTQTATAMLAQANQQPQKILQLLQ